ncbi:MAG: hypothetical protein PHR06_05440, partial [Candidatus Cloacimonetes bacterium]|nr:hypothetical protein [Candidatus Cloacimonadota bacterium]
RSIYDPICSNLFARQSEIAPEKLLRETIRVLDVLIDLHHNHRDYLKDLKFVIKNLQTLPDYTLSRIKNINLKETEQEIEKIKTEIPAYYLTKLISRAQEVDAGEEKLILALELKKNK